MCIRDRVWDAQRVRQCYESFAALYAGDFRRAAAISERLRRSGPSSGLIDYVFGYANLELGQLQTAVQALQSAVKDLEGEPLEPFAWHSLGGALVKLHRYQEGVSAVRRSVQLRGPNPEAYMLMSGAYYMLKDFEGAKASLTQLLALDPTNTTCTLLMANTLMSLRDYEAALLRYKIALDLGDKSGGAHVNMGLLLTWLGRYEEAKEHLVIATERLTGRYARLHVALFVCLWVLRDEGCWRELRKALEISRSETVICLCRYLVHHCEERFRQMLAMSQSPQSGAPPPPSTTATRVNTTSSTATSFTSQQKKFSGPN